MIEYLDAGDKVEVVNRSGQASNAKDFVTMMQRQTGAAVGLSYEAHSRDMSQVNYSSARQGLIDDHATYKRWQNHLITHLLVPVYERFVEACVLAGLLTLPDYFQNRERYHRCTFIPNSIEWIDPLKEASANKIALATGQTNLEKICAARGEDYREVLQQRAVELNYMRELGILPQEGVNTDGTADNAGTETTQAAPD